MGKGIIRFAAIFPICFCIYFSMYPEAIYIKGFNVYFSEIGALRFLMLVLLIWFGMLFPLRKACMCSNIVEMAYNMLPVEVFLLMVFSQYHPIITGLLVILPVLICSLFYWWIDINYMECLAKKKKWKRNGSQCRAMKKRIMCRVVVISISATLFIPSLIAVFVYDMRQPLYAPIQNESTDVSENRRSNRKKTVEKMLEENQQLSYNLRNWDELTIEEKIENLQLIVDFETECLGIKAVSIKSIKLNLYIEGQYDSAKNQIWIDIWHLQKNSFDQCCGTILHEVFHSYQYYVINSVDWEHVEDCLYFAKAKEWLDNSRNYVSGYEDYDAYYNQAMEKDARDFADNEIKKYISYLY